MEDNVRKWAQDATEKLRIGREVGNKANGLLNVTKERIKRTNNSLIKANFLLDSFNQQLQLIQTVNSSIELNIENKRVDSESMMSYLIEAIELLKEEFERLKTIKVDKALASDEPSLFDFISGETLEDLEIDYDQTEKLISVVLDELDQRYKALKGKLRELNMEFAELEQVINKVNDTDWIDDSIEETNKFEEEIAELIESLTSHYDQCSKGVAIIDGKADGDYDDDDDEKSELFKVLENDYEESQEVINDINEVYGDIEEKCARIDEFLTINSFNTQLSKFGRKLFSFGEKDLVDSLFLLKKHTSTLQRQHTRISEHCDEANGLIKHYEKFIKSYYSLILELERRRKAQDTIRSLIKDAQSKINSLQEDDYRFRSSFKQNNAEYLPGDLWSGFNEDDPLVELSFQFNELPQISDFTLSIAKRHFQ